MIVSLAARSAWGSAGLDAQAQTGTILDRIVEARRAAMDKRRRLHPLPVLRMAVKQAGPPRDFFAALRRPGLNVIAELKKASPSRGVLRADFDPRALGARLASAGAVAISVLTEEEFFQGSLAHLRGARAVVSVPVLRKDFLFDPWQVWEARSVDADSFLLIAAILSDGQLADLLAAGRELGMEPLVEVHSREELHRVLRAGARIIGVNNRDLRTFDVRLDTSLELIREIPRECLAVSESGLCTASDLARLRDAGFSAFLVGESLMRAPDPAAALRALLGGTAPEGTAPLASD
jgi:indole-3-glycerol phosphate synthase